MSLSSRSIRNKPSVILGTNSQTQSNKQNQSNAGLNNHTTTSISSQPLLNSNSSTYARSIYEDESMILNEPSIHQSASSNTLNTHSTTPPNPNSNQSSTTTTTTTTTNTAESLLSLANKRITTLIYLKKVHEGKVHWFNTILLSRSELEKWFDHSRMINRTTRFAILGMSLSSLLDITNLQDFLKAMIHLLHELETIPSDNNYKPKISNLSRGIFKQSKSARKSAGGTDYAITLQDSGDPSFLYTPNIPFDLDYFEVWITLSDILVEVYQKMINFISNSSAMNSNNTNSNNSNPLTNNNNSNTNNSSGSSSSSSNGKANSINGTNSNNNTAPISTSAGSNPSSLSNTPVMNSSSSISVPIPPTRSSSSYSILSVNQPILNHHHLESIARIDSKLKKLIVILTKEIDGMARAAIREELAQLDPMLSTNSTTSYNLDDLNQNVEWD